MQHIFKNSSDAREPIGRCIYCPNPKGLKLTNEHVFPDALGGNMVLEDACCLKCQQTITAFETSVIGNMFKPFTRAFNVPNRSYRPKSGKTFGPFVTKVEVDGETDARKVPVADAPYAVPIIRYDRAPRLLRQSTPEQRRTYGDFAGPSDTPERIQKLNIQGRGFKVPGAIFNDGFYKQFVAKIAHCYAVYTLGISAFEPYLLPLIVGNDLAPFGPYIGCADPLEEFPHMPATQTTRTHGIAKVKLVDDFQALEQLCVVYFKLFPFLERFSTYEVVVGRMIDPQTPSYRL